jgi:hypothetical protein
MLKTSESKIHWENMGLKTGIKGVEVSWLERLDAQRNDSNMIPHTISISIPISNSAMQRSSSPELLVVAIRGVKALNLNPSCTSARI